MNRIRHYIRKSNKHATDRDACRDAERAYHVYCACHHEGRMMVMHLHCSTPAVACLPASDCVVSSWALSWSTDHIRPGPGTCQSVPPLAILVLAATRMA